MEFEPALSRRDILPVDLSIGRPGANKKAVAADEEFRFGIEEEYFLSDSRTLEIAADIPQSLFDTARAETDGRIAREFLQPQVEVGTAPHVDLAAARADLLRLRQTAAGQHGFSILASGTHPTAHWRKVEQTPGERYSAVMNGLQMIGQRNMLCGMHVHVEFPHLEAVDRAIAVENKWRAQRYGVQGTLVTRNGAITVGEMLECVLEDIAPDAAALHCEAELADCRKIIAAGTSADAQLSIFHAATQLDGEDSALHAVTRWIAAETVKS
jgi:gamma-glutamyl:cysteine ligase YbdK (ATP-grasp superfamily)